MDDVRQVFHSFCGESFSGTVLDVGCGLGHLRDILGLSNRHYLGVDWNEVFVKAGRRRYPGIELLRAAAARLPFRDNQFDCVVCSDVLIHLEDMRPALREIIRVSRQHVLLRLRTGNGAGRGRKMIYDPYQKRLFSRVQLEGIWYYAYYNVLSPDDLKKILRQVGVGNYTCVDLLPPDDEKQGLTKVFFDANQGKSS